MTKQNGRTHLRGFASLSDERKKEIASMGGRSVPPEKRAFSVDRELAAEAGRKGGMNYGVPRDKA